MAITIIDKHIPSTDGIHTLRGKVYLPEGEVRGILQISHGMAEHIARYAEFMTYLAENGFIAAAHDHIGHGLTAENEKELGFFAEKDGWRTVCRDVIAFSKSLKEEYPEKPLILMGHSMGSFIARIVCAEAKDLYSAYIFMGTGGANPMSSAGLALTSILTKTKGPRHISSLVYAAAFGTYNNRTEKDDIYAWLSTDREMVKKYHDDPLCGFHFTVSAMHDLIKMQDIVNRTAWYAAIPKDRPILLIAGEEDPVGTYGKGVQAVHKKMIASGAQKASLKLYPKMRHEVLNEMEKVTVYTDLLDFLKENI